MTINDTRACFCIPRKRIRRSNSPFLFSVSNLARDREKIPKRYAGKIVIGRQVDTVPRHEVSMSDVNVSRVQSAFG